MAYLLDANVFIQAKNLHYGFDICPAFGNWLDEGIARGSVVSISHVGDELAAGTDDLADWAKARMSRLFPSPDASTLASLTRVSQWAANGGFGPAAVNTFLQIADSFLVAVALAGSHTVVTHELHANSTICCPTLQPRAQVRAPGSRIPQRLPSPQARECARSPHGCCRDARLRRGSRGRRPKRPGW